MLHFKFINYLWQVCICLQSALKSQLLERRLVCQSQRPWLWGFFVGLWISFNLRPRAPSETISYLGKSWGHCFAEVIKSAHSGPRLQFFTEAVRIGPLWTPHLDTASRRSQSNCRRGDRGRTCTQEFNISWRRNSNQEASLHVLINCVSLWPIWLVLHSQPFHKGALLWM